MGNGASEEATQTVRGQELAGQFPAGELANPPPPNTAEATAPSTALAVVRHGPGVTATASAAQDRHLAGPAGRVDRPPEVVRYGPGVPAGPQGRKVELTAEHVWRADSPGRPSRRRQFGRLMGGTLTLILLGISGVLIYPRIHHAPFHVTGVSITQQVHNGCGVDVTGQISTNGSAGTVAYQWLLEPSQQPPQPLSQSAAAGQRAVYVTVAVNGTGHGSAAQTVLLQILGPDTRTVSARITVSC